jgi:2,3-bisphosphoglycerate-dependent phosphoglycerate mutase
MGSRSALEVILVRHAAPVLPGTPGWETRDDERPLSADGRRQAAELAVGLDEALLTAVYSSPYARAWQTVEPAAARHGLAVQPLHDLRERRLRSTLGDDWRERLERSWADPDLALEGGESGREAQRRGLATLDLLRSRHSDGGCLLAGSHGNLISLVLQAFDPRINLDFHLAMPMPAAYHLEHDGTDWRIIGGPGLKDLRGRR